jgi:hypothetical protein
MKKTMIALAAVAAVGSVSAQVAITGGVDFTWGKSIATNVTAASFAFNPATGGTTAVPASGGVVKRGLVATDAYIDLAVTEDLGDGWKAKGEMEFNADGAWGSGMYSGDTKLTLTTPVATVGWAATRSGGILNNIMLAPIVSPTDHWGDTGVGNDIMARAQVDAMGISMPLATGLTGAYKYVEAGAGYGTPSSLTHVLAAYYANGPFGLNYEFNSRAYPDNVQGDIRQIRHDITGTYDAGVAKFALGYESGFFGTWNGSSAGKAAGAFFASVKGSIARFDLGMNYGKRDDASFVELGAQYNITKQTYVATSYSTFTASAVTVSGTAATAVAGGAFSSDSWGIRVGKNF